MSLQSIPVTFKEVWTTNTRQFHVNPHWTVTQFIQSVKPHLAREFNANNFDIVETGQNLPGIPSEDGQALQYSDIKLKHKWGYNLNVSFYVRRRNYNYPELQNYYLSSNTNNTDTTNNTIVECPICFETSNLASRYGCSHGICNACFHRCRQENYIVCPVCRGSQFNEINYLN